MRQIWIRVFVVLSLVWMTASVIDIARRPRTMDTIVELAGLTILGLFVILLIGCSVVWVVDAVDARRKGLED